MKKTLFTALLVGFLAAGAATPVAAQTTPAPEPAESAETTPTLDRPARPLTQAELKRRQKVRKRTGPVVYKGRIAEQSEFLTDTDDGKDADKPGKKTRKTNRRKN